MHCTCTGVHYTYRDLSLCPPRAWVQGYTCTCTVQYMYMCITCTHVYSVNKDTPILCCDPCCYMQVAATGCSLVPRPLPPKTWGQGYSLLQHKPASSVSSPSPSNLSSPSSASVFTTPPSPSPPPPALLAWFNWLVVLPTRLPG